MKPRTIAAALLASIMGAGSAYAAPADETTPQNTPVAMGFVDLTGGANPQTALPPDSTPGATRFLDLSRASNPRPVTSSSAAAPAGFVDFTNGGQTSATPAAVIPVQKTARRMKVVDLQSGDPLPDFDSVDENPEPASDVVTITADRLVDPFEETNRDRFQGHVRLHRYVIDPVERAYVATLPTPARDGVHNFLTNLETPSILANDLLQGDLGRAGNTLSRFVVNTTLGLGGLFDIAGRAGIPFRDDDFGATLAVYGVGEGPYLLVPVLGPSNPRDLSGKVVDFLIDPLHYLTVPGGIVTSVTKTGFHELDKRSYDVGDLDELARTQHDAYAAERARARAERNTEIFGTPPAQ